MTERVKIKDRVLFDKDKKMKVLHKSKGVCSHCGKPLDLETMTVDHVIPLSKGGTNELKNLVALCENCNKSKSNYVVDPEDYFKHLVWIYLQNLIKSHKEYSEKVRWVSKRQVFSEDMQYVTSMNNMGMILDKGRCLVKAGYSDLDDIYHAYIRFHDRKCDKMYSKEDRRMLKLFISFIFTEGCFYIYRNSSGDVALAVPVLMALIELSDNRLIPMVFLTKILMVYKKPDLSTLLFGFLMEINKKGLNWSKDISLGVQMSISVFGYNSELDSVLDFIATHSPDTQCVRDKNGYFLKFTVYSGDLEKLKKTANFKQEISEEEYNEEVEKLIKFFKDINVVRLENGVSWYFLIREISLEGIEEVFGEKEK